MGVDFRPYADGEEQKILSLFRHVFGWDLSLDFWRWRQLENPAGGPWTEMGWDGERLVGHYAASAAKLCVNGEPVSACLSMSTMVHQDYRGQGIFERSAESIYARLKDSGVKAVFGFPNNKVHRPRIQKVGWQDIYEIPTLVHDIADAQRWRPTTALTVQEFDARFDRFWDRVKCRHAIWSWRDSKSLAWRFTKNPINKYQIGVVADGHEIKGYIVVKRYLDKGLDIVDLVTEENAALGDLIAWATNMAIDLKLPRLNMWASTETEARKQVEVNGFVPTAPVTYFGGRVFADDLEVDFFDRRLWNYSMSDSDLY
jgi:GNAT superfamily N-acetyltransferase